MSISSCAVFTHAIRGEIIRICTFLWCQLIVAFTFLVVIMCALCANVRVLTAGMSHAERIPDGIGLSLSLVLFTVFGALLASLDLRSGEPNMSLLAIPNRFRLGMTRVTACSSIVAMFAGSLFICDRTIRHSVSDRAIPTSVPLLLMALSFTLTSVTYAMLGFVLAELTRNTMISIAFLTLMPILVMPLVERATPHIAALLPFNAGSMAQGSNSQSPFAAVDPVAWGFLTLSAWWCISATVLVTHIVRKGGFSSLSLLREKWH